MDGSTFDHSDSDSGESWTLLEHSPAHGNDAPEINSTVEKLTTEINIDKDEDTDGISVISDSEPESSNPCELDYDKSLAPESRPTEILNHQFISVNPLAPNNNNNHESIRSEDDFLGDNTGKHKTYVHRRNKRLSTVLNIIMLGSVITAAGVAIGHMWGARNECSFHTTPSINKILSNLYKLQEENAYLRNKLKELTLASSIQMQQRRLSMEKIPFKQQRCKKVYEEPLNSKNTDKITKCLDNENIIAEKVINSHIMQPDYEKEFITDIEKLKNIYQQNKSWLDDEVSKRIKNEEKIYKKMAKKIKTPLTSIVEEQKVYQDENMQEQTDISESAANEGHKIALELNAINEGILPESPPNKKISYADSLKSAHKIQKRDINTDSNNEKGINHIVKKKIKNENDAIIDILSEEELKKDDRYAGPKIKQDRKKRDRQKLHKKQKRRNKYEQWEMKGGYLKDYDEFSITSSQENDFIFKKPDRNVLSRDFEKKNYINQFSETTDNQNNKSEHDNQKTKEKQSSKADKTGGKNNKNDDLNWYDKRAFLRTEARKRLEHELFGDTSPNNAGWYFRRMQRREQCRAKGDNSTYKKLSKRNMNFKMKH